MKAWAALNADFCKAEGIPYSHIVRTWAQIALGAENKAEAELIKREQKRAK